MMRSAWAFGALGAAAIGACAIDGSVGAAAGRGGGASSAGGFTTSTSSTVTSPPRFDKIDILLAIDDTPSMSEKQQILGDALLDLVDSLANPPCVDDLGQPVAGQPSGPLDDCPSGSTRQFSPITDIHVAVVTSSLGGHGSDACQSPDVTSCPGGVANPSVDDRGRLITRTDPCGTAVVPTYANKGFLAWDPRQQDVPPGTANLTDFSFGARALELGAGAVGCRFPSQLESWYRFLVDPDPYLSLSVSGGEIQRSGSDGILVVQRQDFLRSDSLLAILMLSDRDDCSVRESGDGWKVTQLHDPESPSQPYHLPRGRSECAKDPNDPCCLPCLGPQKGCPADPTCATDPYVDAQSDGYDLRCWDQKRRFGDDFLYTTDRYVRGLTQPMVPDSSGQMVANPIFTNLDPGSTAPVRDPSLVFLAAVAGVPWQDLARHPDDLLQGFKDADERVSSGTWGVILSDPVSGNPPGDPHMIASPFPRSGVDPVTGTALAPPGSADDTDPISGHEYTPETTPDDLQYACIFPLTTPRDCTAAGAGCDCADPQNDSPLCAPDPTKSFQRTLQVRAKAYPATRQLQVIRDLGTQGVLASICPGPESDPNQADYGYRPAVRALLEQLGRRAMLP